MSSQEEQGGTPPSTDFVERINLGFAAVGGWSFDHRWAVVAVGVLSLVVSLAFAARMQIDNSYEAYFDESDPTYLNYETYREDFGSDEWSYILYHAPDYEYGPWNYEVMQKIVSVTEAIEDEVPFIYDATSLANGELMVGDNDDIQIHKLSDEFPETQEELLELRARYLEKPMMVGGIVNESATYAAIRIKMDRSSTDPLEDIRFDPEGGDGLENLYPQVTNNKIAEILARPEYAGIEFFHSGDVPLNAAFNDIIAEESAFLDLITSIVIAALLAFFFRSLVGVIAPVAVVQLSVIMTVAFIVAIGWKLDLTFSGTPTLLTAIAVAHSVHILSEFRHRFRKLGDRRAALVKTMYLVGAPCLFTSLTTAIGFASMVVAPIKAISRSGIYSAFGVMAAFFLSFTLLMALLSFGRREPRVRAAGEAPPPALGDRALTAVLDRTVSLVTRHRRAVLATFGAVFALSIVGITQIIVDSNWLNDFSERMPLKQITIHVDEVMGGVTNLIIVFDAGEEGGIKNPEALQEIDRIQTWANEQKIVRKSYAITDILKDLNQTFHGNDAAYHVLPESRELAAQFLVLYESAGGAETEELVSSDYQTASLELRLALAMTSETADLVAGLEEQFQSPPLSATTVHITGIGMLWVKLLGYIVDSQIMGFTLAFSVIALIMMLLFRSILTGLIAMIPNVSPVFLTLGIMGWLAIPLDYNKVMIAAVAMGIAIDDTIHVMTRVRYEFLRLGNYEAALREGLMDVGRAISITSIALVLGFLVLTLSLLHSNAVRGVLLATTIMTALIADFLLMPALILTFKPFGRESRSNHEIEASGLADARDSVDTVHSPPAR
ncbi:MAG: MMPL family transporter [Myxococcota bacterium]|nr:MMPL family transporter [Myxococcota bacterium]